MKKSKWGSAVALAAALVVSLTACTGGSKDASATVQAAAKKMQEVKSMDAVMTMEMDMSVAGESLAISTIMNSTSFTDPLKCWVDLSMDMGTLGNMDMTVYAEESGENYTLYTGMDGQWVVQDVTAEELGQYDAHSSMDIYLENSSNFTSAGTEELAGGTADKYTGVIKGKSIKQALQASGALNNLGALTMGADTEDLFSDLGDMPITIWVDQASGYPVRYEMDMSEIMQKLMSDAMSATSSDSENPEISLTMSIECSNFNNATDFTIPEEARAAAN